MTAQTGTAPVSRAKACRIGRAARTGLLVCLTVFAGALQAFENLTPAQTLIYGTSHLANTVSGQQIVYLYRGRMAEGELVEDRATLSINASYDGDKRDVALDFLSAERHLALPDFTAFRGNPLIIAMLEHIAQSFGRETGGGVLYFRNRIRDGMAAKDARIEKTGVEYGGNTVDATRLTFEPFAGDPYLAERPEYTSAVFSITLSAEVPGGVVGVAARSGDGVGNGFVREISIIDQ